VVGRESVPLSDARGRVLARGETAPMDLPPFPCSAMDGYALPASSLGAAPPHTLELRGASLAGHPFTGSLASGQCIRITTGAAVPDTCDLVVAQEDCTVHAGAVTINVQPRIGDHVRRRGGDVVRGQPLLPRGTELGPYDLAWLAACGTASVDVMARPTVAFFSTGDELRDPPAKLGPGQIYDSNRRAVGELLRNLPVRALDLGTLADDPDVLRTALAEAAAQSDLVVTSGGVSVGTADYLKDVVAALGSLDLWRLNLKPGKPLAFGRIAGTPFLGLPGNPVSTIVTFLLIARPVILHLAGAAPRPPIRFGAILTDTIRHAPGREEYQRGHLEGAGSRLSVRPTGDQSSNRLATFSGADCLIRIPKDAGDLSVGTSVEVLPLRSIGG